jgi:hypothetical protein
MTLRTDLLRCCLPRLVLALAVAGALGCGSKTGKVRGKVTLNGTPVPGGTITFIPDRGKQTGGIIAEDGTYIVANVPVGEAKVTVEPASTGRYKEVQQQINSIMSRVPPGVDPRRAKLPQEQIDELEKLKQEAARLKKFQSWPKQFEALTLTVASGSQDVDIALKPKTK